jgi:ATP-dependent Clp protease adaptor protein ClpS
MRLDPFANLDLEVEFQQELEELVQSPKALVIHNDDYNSFDFVIETLIEYCGHEPLQAEQCTFIIHYSGKCAVKTDAFSKLQPVWARILNLGLTATIEDIPKISK